MRRFELVEGTSSKFWEITLADAPYTVRSGRIGTNGQTQTKAFDAASTAAREHDRLVAEKLKKGYTETDHTPAHSTAASAGAAGSAVPVVVTRAVDRIPAVAPETLDANSGEATSGPTADLTGVEPPTDAAAVASDMVIDEDRVFWDAALYRRVWARRGVSLLIGSKVLAPRDKLAQLDQPKFLPQWDRRLRTYLASQPGDHRAALEFISHSHGLGVDWIAAREGVPFALEILAQVTGDALQLLSVISELEDLRSRFAALPDQEYEVAEAIARSASAAPAGFALAFLFPTETWACTVADAQCGSCPMLLPQCRRMILRGCRSTARTTSST